MLANMLYVYNLKITCISCHLRRWHREISQKASVQCETALVLIKTEIGPLVVSPLCYEIKCIPPNPTDVSLVIQQFHTGRTDGTAEQSHVPVSHGMGPQPAQGTSTCSISTLLWVCTAALLHSQGAPLAWSQLLTELHGKRYIGL